ncbi:Protein of unknown function [Mesobacillus persicus]|uniref:DUF3895 domain-containing protein n=1 Tax=Mesobacillus persicus TaxID=930146 RepID=A0A1H8AT21_9BACI|nr:DUF3895 domain-containing protein [Mesobacillus persicus]SEM73656.1 Protein of unknown function [Mesobacillus persicus]
MITLDVSERDEVLKGLSTQQKEFIDLYVKRGKRTSFANVLARDKGIVLPHSATIEEIEMILDEWVLEDYIDNGFVNPETPCECGKPLRYQYIVKHLTTNQIRRFGITHFEEHTGLPADIIASVKKGFNQIDYERDELLSKIRDGWSLIDYISNIPEDLQLAKDIKSHLDAGIPLLDRQLNRLKRDIDSHLERKEEKVILTPPNPTRHVSQVEKNTIREQATFDLFKDFNEESPPSTKRIQRSNYNNLSAINQYLDEGVTSARIISELLIKHHGASNKRYITGKPRIYVEVCQYLEGLVDDGKLSLEEVVEKVDRSYKIVKGEW